MSKLEVSREFVMQAHKAACEDWKERIEYEFPELFKNMAGWYRWHGEEDFLGYFDGTKFAYGFEAKGGQWFDSRHNTDATTDIHNNPFVKASDTYVERSLIEEARKRYPIGNSFNNRNLGHKAEFNVTGREFYIGDDLKELFIENGSSDGRGAFTVFKNGGWADSTDELLIQITNKKKEIEKLQKEAAELMNDYKLKYKQ